MKHPQFLVFRYTKKNISGRKGHYSSTGTDADFCERMHVSGETLFWATDESVKSLDADFVSGSSRSKDGTWRIIPVSKVSNLHL